MAQSLLHDFLMHRLDPATFSHRDHVEVAWRLLRRHTLDETVALFSGAALDLATRAGARQRFNVTLTGAMIRLVAHDQARGAHADWASYLRSDPHILRDGMGLIADHYSPERLHSETARSTWVEPDRAPLPLLRRVA